MARAAGRSVSAGTAAAGWAAPPLVARSGSEPNRGERASVAWKAVAARLRLHPFRDRSRSAVYILAGALGNHQEHVAVGEDERVEADLQAAG